jgi:hypothetical protein
LNTLPRFGQVVIVDFNIRTSFNQFYFGLNAQDFLSRCKIQTTHFNILAIVDHSLECFEVVVVLFIHMFDILELDGPGENELVNVLHHVLVPVQQLAIQEGLAHDAAKESMMHQVILTTKFCQDEKVR